ncbi:MAG TPA: chemotaxis protein CheC [Longimicrobiales bacterium]|nr:chemotaxis protein CheC [Longimicrobiales bacterium]
MDIRQLDPAQLDAVREIANIGAGHAATALSQMTNRVVLMDVPEVNIVPLEDVDRVLGAPEEVMAAVMMKVLGDLTGRTVQIFPAQTAARLTALMVGGAEPNFPHDFPEAHSSALKEVGNIIVGAYLSALSEFTGKLLLMSVPGFAIDMAAAIMATTYLNFGDAKDYVFCVNTRLHLGEDHLRAHFLLIPDEASLQVILREMRLLA